MKFLIALTIIGAVAGDVSHLYLPPVEPKLDYLPPVPSPQYGVPPPASQYIPSSVGQADIELGSSLAPQTPGYIPPAVEVPEPPSSEYIPPAPLGSQYIPPAPAVSGYIPPPPPPPPAPKYIPSLPSGPEYIPPPPPASKYLPAEEPAPVYESNSDGYRYRTVKRIKYRNRT